MYFGVRLCTFTKFSTFEANQLHVTIHKIVELISLFLITMQQAQNISLRYIEHNFHRIEFLTNQKQHGEECIKVSNWAADC